MKATKYTGTGVVNQNEEFMMYNLHLFKDFFKGFRNQSFKFEFTLIPDDDSSKLNAYYWAEIIPKLRNALLLKGETLDDKETHEYVKWLCPIMRVYENGIRVKSRGGKYLYRDITDEDWGNIDWTEYIRQLIHIAAEHFYIVINDPQIQAA